MSNRDGGLSGAGAVLSSAGTGRTILQVQPDKTFFTQGEPADSVFCLQTGRARLTVVSEKGKQATITLLSPGDFFGEESLATQNGLRAATATALSPCTALKITGEDMIRVMRRDRDLRDRFFSSLLARTMRAQADLVDHLFNCCEKRLARMLLLMAQSGKPHEEQILIPPVTQEALAEMIGTTRSRVSHFMNRFRTLGLIDYKDRIQVDKPRLQAMLDRFAEA